MIVILLEALCSLLTHGRSTNTKTSLEGYKAAWRTEHNSNRGLTVWSRHYNHAFGKVVRQLTFDLAYCIILRLDSDFRD